MSRIFPAILGISFTVALLIPVLAWAQSLHPAHLKTSEKPFFRKPFLLGAHRGGAGVWPESTLVAFTHAAKDWPNALLETDARMTSDGYVVLCHDATVDRTTNGTGPIASKTLAQVQALDAGYRFTRDGGKTFPYRGKGVKIPTLAEVLSALPHSRFLVEMKDQPGIADPTIKVLKQTNAEDRVLLASFNPKLMERAEALAPRVACCYDFTNGMQLLKRLQNGTLSTYTPTADVLSIDPAMLKQYNLTPKMLQEIRKKGIRLQFYTIDKEAEMRKLLAEGVDSILSDRPDLLAKVIAETHSGSTPK